MRRQKTEHLISWRFHEGACAASANFLKLYTNKKKKSNNKRNYIGFVQLSTFNKRAKGSAEFLLLAMFLTMEYNKKGGIHFTSNLTVSYAYSRNVSGREVVTSIYTKVMVNNCKECDVFGQTYRCCIA